MYILDLSPTQQPLMMNNTPIQFVSLKNYLHEVLTGQNDATAVTCGLHNKHSLTNVPIKTQVY